MKPAPLPFGRARPLPLLMGVLNVTPDSFSDGQEFLEKDKAIAHAIKMMDEGADIIDIGGESTRPGATPLAPIEEQRRVIPVFEALREDAQKRSVLLSVDTRNASTMRMAVKAGASIINDVSALTHDQLALQTVAEMGAHVALMHMQGSPETMQQNPNYKNVIQEIATYLSARIEACLKAGIAKEKMIVDPGIGFGKTPQHNIEILKNISAFHALGVPVLIGASRKSFIAAVTGACEPDERLGGSIAAALAAAAQGAQILRVHDVFETAQAIKINGLLYNKGN